MKQPKQQVRQWAIDRALDMRRTVVTEADVESIIEDAKKLEKYIDEA